jgi:RNA polymerase sigma-70 factor, ECF subfamily
MLLVEDRKLLERFRRGEKDALETVYRAYAPRLAAFLRGGFSFNSGGRRLSYRGTRSAFDLEDRMHDVFCRAFSERARLAYDGLTPYEAYIITIARNVVIDEFRKKENELVELGIEEEREPMRGEGGDATEPLLGSVVLSGDPARDAEAAELVSLVNEFKGSLGEREREVFKLRFEEEREHKDIGEATGLSASKIKTSEQRIRALFFDFMRERGYFAQFQKTRQGWLTALRSMSF